MAEREILFRGKRKDNGEWITDSETYIRDGDGIWLSDENLNVVQVIPETVGQFTGMTDKNGVKIFEGDIVRFVSGGYSNFVILWDNKDALWFLRAKNYTTDFYHHFSNEFEVIGNIYDNPEILKGGENDG